MKMEVLGKKDIETTTMANFCSQVSVFVVVVVVVLVGSFAVSMCT